MGLLRKHMHDDAGRRIPVYRTGWWPWRLPHEQAIPGFSLKRHFRLIGLPDARLDATAGYVSTGLFLCGFLVVGSAFVLMRLGVAGGPARLAMLASVVAAVLLGSCYARKAWVVFRYGHAVDPERRVLILRRLGHCGSCGYEHDDDGVCSECGATWRNEKRLPAKGSRSNESSD